MNYAVIDEITVCCCLCKENKYSDVHGKKIAKLLVKLCKRHFLYFITNGVYNLLAGKDKTVIGGD